MSTERADVSFDENIRSRSTRSHYACRDPGRRREARPPCRPPAAPRLPTDGGFARGGAGESSPATKDEPNRCMGGGASTGRAASGDELLRRGRTAACLRLSHLPQCGDALSVAYAKLDLLGRLLANSCLSASRCCSTNLAAIGSSFARCIRILTSVSLFFGLSSSHSVSPLRADRLHHTASQRI